VLVVVGGHSRNIGKTSVVAGLIRRLRGHQWAAVKITQFGHGVCSHAGEACGCKTEPEHPFALSEEFEPSRTDSGRFLAAGAHRSFWLRTPMGQLSHARTTLEKILGQNENVILESNSVLELVQPDLFLMVLDFGCQDFKASSLRFMDRADAYLVVDRGINGPLWDGIAQGIWDTKPQFLVKPPTYITAELCDFVQRRLAQADQTSRSSR
jgi:molybdopterin-guanine dinucleotide biosynthesis protein